MLVDASGRPYTAEETTPQHKRTPCPHCGSQKSRNVHEGFSRHWRLTCQQCGTEIVQGRGDLPEEEV